MCSNTFDEPKYTLHFQADAPISLNTLFFVPSQHSEKYGMGRMEPGVSLYSRKVLVESKSPDSKPTWVESTGQPLRSSDFMDTQFMKVRDEMEKDCFFFQGVPFWRCPQFGFLFWLFFVSLKPCANSILC